MKFRKYQATGNDFLFFDARDSFPFLDVPFLCNRKKGAGADGIFVLLPGFHVQIFNADGSEAESCGNGLLCLAHFLHDLGYSENEYEIFLKEEKVVVGVFHHRYYVKLGPPKNLLLNQKASFFSHPFHLVNTGVPHLVVLTQDLEIVKWGKILRDRFNANVNFVKRGEEISVRTFERGVEGETDGCGTGAAAVGVITHYLYHQKSPIQLKFPGGTLGVRLMSKNNRIQSLNLLGCPCFVYSGEFPGKNFMGESYGYRHSEGSQRS